MRSRILFLLLPLLFAACGGSKEPERVAERFLTEYLECRFGSAARMALPEVVDLMRWRASNLTQAELELLGQQSEGIQTETERVEDYGDSCVVVLMAHNCLVADSVGVPGYIGSSRYRVTLKKKKGDNWMVTTLSL